MNWPRRRRHTPVTPLESAQSPLVQQLLSLIPRPWDENAFLSAFTQLIGCDVWLMPWHFAPGSDITGVWKPTRQRHYVFLSDMASGIDRLAPLFHETVHIALGHKPKDLGFFGSDALDKILPQLEVASPAMVRLMIGEINAAHAAGVMLRHDYQSDEEREVETIATALLLAVIDPRSPELAYINRAML